VSRHILKRFSTLKNFSFLCITSSLCFFGNITFSQAVNLGNLEDVFFKDREEYVAPQILAIETKKDFLEKSYKGCAGKAEKIRQFNPFYSNIREIMTLEVLCNYLAKEYEKNDEVIDKYVELYEGDSETFYLLYMQALGMLKRVKNSETNLSFMEESLNIFRKLKIKIEENKNKPCDKSNENFLLFEDKIDKNIQELSDLIVKNNTNVQIFYMDGDNYVAASLRSANSINNVNEVFSKEEQEKSLQILETIFSRMYKLN